MYGWHRDSVIGMVSLDCHDMLSSPSCQASFRLVIVCYGRAACTWYPPRTFSIIIRQINEHRHFLRWWCHLLKVIVIFVSCSFRASRGSARLSVTILELDRWCGSFGRWHKFLKLVVVFVTRSLRGLLWLFGLDGCAVLTLDGVIADDCCTAFARGTSFCSFESFLGGVSDCESRCAARPYPQPQDLKVLSTSFLLLRLEHFFGSFEREGVVGLG